MSSNRFFISVIILLYLISFKAQAADRCESMQLGWHFYCDPKEVPPKKIEEPLSKMVTAKMQLKNIQEKLEDLKIEAIMDPTPENVANYIAFQNEQMERASKFSNAWQKLLWGRPDLDGSVKIPISTAGNELRSEIKGKQVRDYIKQLNTRYGVFFFYQSSCSYCHKYSPILKAFSDHYSFSVIAISLDGGILPEWPASVIDQGQAARFGLEGKPVPATLLFDNQTQELLPVGFGLLTVSELEDRIYWIVGERQ